MDTSFAITKKKFPQEERNKSEEIDVWMNNVDHTISVCTSNQSNKKLKCSGEKHRDCASYIVL